MQATTHVPKILKKLAETKGTRVWDDAFRSYNDPRFVSFEGITGFKDFYLNCVQISLREELPKLISYNRFVELMRDAVIPLVILLNCCKGKQTGTLTQQKAGRFVITHVLAVIRPLKASLSVGKRRPGWFFGLNDQGEIMSFTLTSGNTDDRAVVEKLTQYLTGLLFGDRWYISKNTEQSRY
ncbi:MAG: Tnp-DDE-dom domain-containing protein [Candidatus Midichloria mitochondrii]